MAAKTASDGEGTLKAWQARLDFTKSLSIVVLVLAFVVYPNALWFVVERAGLSLDEVQFFGAKLKRASTAIAALDAGLKEARLANTVLTQQLSAANDALTKVDTCFSSPDALQQCAKDKRLVDQLQAQAVVANEASTIASNAVASTDSTLRANTAVINESVARVTSNATRWGVVFGGASSLEAAERLIGRAGQPPAGGLAIFVKRTSFRPVVIFDDRGAATEWLSSAEKITPGAYVVAMDQWCVEQKERQRTPAYAVFDCAA
jgi:hypothetical protein